MTSAPQPLATYPPRSVKAWVRVHLSSLLLFLGIVVSTTLFLILIFNAFQRGEIRYFLFNVPPTVYTLTWLTLATLAVRTIGLRYVVRGFYGGFFLAMALGFPLAKLLKIPFGDNLFTVAMWVPFAEELTKTAVLLLLCWGLVKRAGRHPGLADMTLIGAALGLGLAMHEDLLYPRAFAYQNLRGAKVSDAFTDPWGMVFPTGYEYAGIIGVGHLSSGVILGFGVGLLALLWRRSRLVAIFSGASFFALTVALHGIWNSGALTSWTAFHTLVFLLEPWLTLLLVIGAICVDLVIRNRFAPANEKPRWRDYQIAHRASIGNLDWVERVMCVTHYRHEYQAVANFRFYDPALAAQTPDPRLTALRRRALQVAPAPTASAPPPPGPPPASQPPLPSPPPGTAVPPPPNMGDKNPNVGY